MGRKADLLEHMRRTEEQDQLTLELVLLQASTIGLDPALTRKLVKRDFLEDRLIDFDGEKISLRYSSTTQVYAYSSDTLLPELSAAELNLLKLVCSSTRRAVGVEDFDKVLQSFPRAYREPLRNFLFKNKLLQSFPYQGTDYVVSPRAFKAEKNFKMAVEVLSDAKMSGVVDFIRENPGNPDAVVQIKEKIDPNTLEALEISGVVDPLTLDVNGDRKNYLFSPDILRKRSDSDNSDLVKTTLANFRYGEYYSKHYRLFSLEKFLQSLVDRGFAGSATPIGTDYRELETQQIVRVEPIEGTSRHRFWLLKKDVVEDALSVIRGIIPITVNSGAGGLDSITGVVRSRSNLNMVSERKSVVTDAIRKIQEGVGVS